MNKIELNNVDLGRVTLYTAMSHNWFYLDIEDKYSLNVTLFNTCHFYFFLIELRLFV